MLSATNPGLASDLAAEAGLVVASGPVTGDLGQRLADLAVGDSALAPVMGRGLPIAAPLWASIGNSRPSAPESAPGAVTAKLAITDILQRQRQGSATMIADATISGRGSFRIVPIEVTELR